MASARLLAVFLLTALAVLFPLFCRASDEANIPDVTKNGTENDRISANTFPSFVPDDVVADVGAVRLASVSEGKEQDRFGPRHWLGNRTSASNDPARSRQSSSKLVHNTTMSLRDPSACQNLPSVDDLSQYLHSCQNCMVRSDRYQCPLHDQVLELKKRMTELQDLLSYGCRTGNGGSTGRCCHSRDPSVEGALQEITQLTVDLHNLFLDSCESCPGDGEWSEWSDWSACTVTCGEGTQVRNRKCNNPVPKGSGRFCQGSAVDTASCYRTDCHSDCRKGTWAEWDRWSLCSASCGSGVRVRQRRCDNPPPSYCGETCLGDSIQRDTCYQYCDSVTTPARGCVDGGWGDWGRWSQCSASCGEAVRERKRCCDNPKPSDCGQDCRGDTTQTEPCRNLPQCDRDPVCQWTPWGQWSRCTATCGEGVIERSRSCEYPGGRPCSPYQCAGDGTETRQQQCGPTPRNGNWGSWEGWSPCPVTCGYGFRQRQRRCDSPPPNSCGQTCRGQQVDSDTCDTRIPCFPPTSPRPFCGWTPWGQWSTCTITCGEGVIERSRSCEYPGGRPCSPYYCAGDGTETRQQQCGPTPRNGNWGFWEAWSPCPVTCGNGFRQRQRRCDSPPPNSCGQTCRGQQVDSDTCDTRTPCFPSIPSPPSCDWTPWGQWSRCTITCGEGQVERSRSCEYLDGRPCSYHCQGLRVETRQQQCGATPRNGNWGSWEAWSPCPVTCGYGFRQRQRRCDSPPPNSCGQTCRGQQVDSDTCDTRIPCFPPTSPRPSCGWTPWGQWSTCTITCGEGVIERSRSCEYPGGRPCSPYYCAGDGTETRQQQCGPTPRNGNWGFWEVWSPCPVTCGNGFRQRQRRCDSPPPNSCGQTCRGQQVDSDTCDTRTPCFPSIPSPPSCEWTPWAEWSRCTVSCGEGLVERSRSCVNPDGRPCATSDCPGPGTDARRQRCGPEAENGNWGLWQPWSQCSATCGEGTRQRKRRCDSPPPSECGMPCRGPTVEQDRCQTPPCSCEWRVWSEWSPCTVTCGQGMVERRRSCEYPDGRPCSPYQCQGLSTETLQRLCGSDPRDGTWGSWETWSTCSDTCGLGQQLRRRRCSSPPPNDCGRPCPGPDMEILECDERSQWTPWSPCSATCGHATRTRRRTCRPACGDTCRGWDIETTPCPGPEMPPCEEGSEWGEWEAWCPCDCRKGRSSRRRMCTQRSWTREVTTLDVRACGAGDSRQERFCDVRKDCPVCVLSCTNLKDGDYPSCTSCSDYVSCSNGQMSVRPCRGASEWDSFIRKCRGGNSPSCSLQPCVRSCQGLDNNTVTYCDGTCASYVTCRNEQGARAVCPYGKEFNAFSERCEAEQSPTCRRTTPNDVLYGDAPADSYFDMEEADAEERYQQLVKQTGVAAILHRDNDTGTLFKSQADGDKSDYNLENTLRSKNEDKLKAAGSSRAAKKGRKEVTCQTDCAGVPPGMYQSCLGSCDQYVVCTQHGLMRTGRCPRNKKWDDTRKKCRKQSLTCDSLSPGVP